MKRFLSIAATSLVIGGILPASAQQSTPKTAPTTIRLYTLDCGQTEFKDADVFSDTGEYESKYLALPTPCYLIQHGKEWLL